MEDLAHGPKEMLSVFVEIFKYALIMIIHTCNVEYKCKETSSSGCKIHSVYMCTELECFHQTSIIAFQNQLAQTR